MPLVCSTNFTQEIQYDTVPKNSQHVEFGIETIVFVLVGTAHHDTLLSVAIVMMSPEDEYDIKESFHVIDEEKTGEINIDQLETLCLGLGYNVQREELERSIQQTSTLNDRITVDIALVLLSKVRVLV